jgi:hypothetical protein
MPSHSRRHAHSHARTYTHMHADKNTQPTTHKFTHTHSLTRTHTFSRTHIQPLSHTHARTHSHINTQLHTHTCKETCTYLHTKPIHLLLKIIINIFRPSNLSIHTNYAFDLSSSQTSPAVNAPKPLGIAVSPPLLPLPFPGSNHS